MSCSWLAASASRTAPGNVTPGFALSTIAEGHGPGAAVARIYLASLNKVVVR